VGAADVVMVGPTRESVRVREGFSVGVDQTFAEAHLEHVKLVVVPGGDITCAIAERGLTALLARAAQTSVVAAICNGVLLVAAAGIADRRRVTHTVVEKYAPRPTWDALHALADPVLARSIYVDEDVVVDAPVITAKPWAAIEFAKHAVRSAGLLTRADAASRVRYLRGLRDHPMGDPYVRYAIFLEQIPGIPTNRDDVEAHVEYLRRLERCGLLELAGPFPEHAGGLVVLRVATASEAENIAAADPFVTRGLRRADVRRWQISCDDSNHLMPPHERE
jgi:putative intracellular protease/amidase/uncharacterized protein YciI